MFPDSGGQYIYLREAYGDLIAFLYGWMLFSVANGGTIAALSVASAAYMGQVFPIVSQDMHVLHSLPSRLRAIVTSNRAAHLATARRVTACIVRPVPDWAHLRERRRPALGRAAAERFHLDEVHGDGGVRRPGIRHRQRQLVELSLARRWPDHGSRADAIDLGAGRGIDRGVLGLRRMGVHHLGRRRSERIRDGMCRWPWCWACSRWA